MPDARDGARDARVARVKRLLRALLVLYPGAFRRSVGEDLVETTAHRWRESTRRHRLTGALRFWWSEGLRFVVDGLLERSRAAPSLRDGARQALRHTVRAPAQQAVAVVTLALGVAAATTIVTVVDAVVFRALPYDGADELYLVHTRFGSIELSSNSLPNVLDLQSSVRSFSWLGAAHDASPVLADGSGDPERVSALYVTREYLPGLGAAAWTGRLFDVGDYAPGAQRVAVVSRSVAERRWGGAAAVGRTVQLDGVDHAVVGVMAGGFRDPEPIESGAVTGAWVPARVNGVFANRDAYWFRLLGRLAPGADVETTRRELNAAGLRLSEAYPAENVMDADSLSFVLHSLHETTVGDVRHRLLLLLGAVVLLLVLACANAASLFLARGVARTPELAVRSALGATRTRLAAQLFGENLVIAAVAGVVGGAVGALAVRWFVAAAPAGTPRLHEVVVDLRALLLIAGLTMLTAVVFGIVPALRGARTAAVAAGGLRATASRPAQRLQSALVALEVAISLVLVYGSALLLNSVAHAMRVHPGFDGDDVVVVDLRPPSAADTHEEELAFHRQLLDEARALSGVARAAMAYSVPDGGGGAYTRVRVEGAGAEGGGEQPSRAPAVGQPPSDEFFRFNSVYGDFFETLDIPLRAGRPLRGDEGASDPLIIVLTEAAARRFFPGEEWPIGRRLAFGPPGSDAPLREVIGIVADVHHLGPHRDAEPQIYVPYGQRPMNRLSLLLETTPGAAMASDEIRRLVSRVAPDVPVDRVESLGARYATTSAPVRFLAFLLSALAVLGFVLGAVGTYATASHAVSRRTREVGIRMALGARVGAVFRLVLARALRISAAGIAAGIVLALVLARFLEAYVYGVSVRDPVTVVAAAAVIGACGVVASLGPALRAARLDVNRVLRED